MLMVLSNVILFAIAKATADTIEHHPDTSIFNNTWWLKEGKLIPYTKYKLDGWHIANSIMVAIFLSMIFIRVDKPILVFGISIILYILTFNLFYNKIFRLKPWR